MKTFEQFVNENNSHIGRTTSWSDKHKRKNVTLSLKDVNNYLNQQNTPIEFIDPKSVEHLLIKVERDSERVENANLDFPIIVVKKDNKFTKILDGQHRVFKCLQNNINKIKCKILNLDNAPIKYRYLFEQFINDDFDLKYEKWKKGGYSDGYNSWNLYKNGSLMAGISNDSTDKMNILIRHIENFSGERGMAIKLIWLIANLTVQTKIWNILSMSVQSSISLTLMRKLI